MNNQTTKFKETELGFIPEEWEISRLEDVVESIIDYRGKTPRKTGEGVPLVTAKVIKDGRINFSNSEYISIDDYEMWMRRGMPKPGDVVVTTEAPLGEVAQLPDLKIALAQRVITLRGKYDVLDNTFLKYYLLSSIGSGQLKSKETGSVVTGIKQSELRKINILVPLIDEQKGIAEILSSLDEKIEVNRKMNKTLEAIAQSLFKRWFVDFEFPDENGKPYRSSGGKMIDSDLGPIPEGWRVGRISDLIRIESGFPFNSGMFDEFGQYKLVTIKNVQDGQFIPTCTDSIAKFPEKLSKHCILKEGDILLSLTGNVGRICIVFGSDYLLNQRVAILIPIDERERAFTYLLFRQKEFQRILMGISRGTAQQNLSPIESRVLEVIIPNEMILDDFGKISNSIYWMMVDNLKQIEALSEVRDSLLPRLMSGKIRV